MVLIGCPAICDVKLGICRRDHGVHVPARPQRINDQLLLGTITRLLEVRKDQPDPIGVPINRREQFRDIFPGVSP